MKQIILSLFLAVSAIASLCAQDQKTSDSIAIENAGLGGMRFYYRGEKLDEKKLTNLLKPNPDAYALLKKAKTNNAVSFVLSFAGGFMLGWELGTSLGGRPINWGIMAGGIGAVGLSIPFSIGAKKNARKAIEVYNASRN